MESIDAWSSWVGGRDAERAANARRRFDQLWAGKSQGVEIHALPAGLQELLRKESAGVDWMELAEEQEALERRERAQSGSGRHLRKQQIRGLAAWRENGCRGILAHATGSGKTVTGIQAIAAHPGPVLVVAPTELVASQWDEQLHREFAGSGRRVHLAGAGETDWKERLVDWVSQPRSERVIVAVAPTASQDLFINQLRRARGLLLVGDEVHRYGAPQYSRILSIDAPQRLGLSATPERAGDPDGTALLMDYFDGIVNRYTIQDAIGDGVLCNYMYYPTVVRLDADELQEWRDLTRRIGKAMAIAGGSRAAMASPSVRALVMQRARVAKKAAAKVPVAVSLVARNFEPGQRWLVYCEDIPQMEAVQHGLLDAGVPARVYHSAMAGDKASSTGHALTLSLHPAAATIAVASPVRTSFRPSCRKGGSAGQQQDRLIIFLEPEPMADTRHLRDRQPKPAGDPRTVIAAQNCISACCRAIASSRPVRACDRPAMLTRSQALSAPCGTTAARGAQSSVGSDPARSRERARVSGRSPGRWAHCPASRPTNAGP